MRNHGYQSYFDNEILAASPLKLVAMLYDAALHSIAAARRHIRQGDIRARTAAINKTIAIITELSACLNHDAGGILSRNLAGLYGYVLRLLIEANTKQSEAPLAEAESLLSTLAGAWVACTSAIPEQGFPNRELIIPQDAFGGDSSWT
ncbi:MAG: flagellar export chaperone FliS, partial [Bryobacteraceae bacterium]